MYYLLQAYITCVYYTSRQGLNHQVYVWFTGLGLEATKQHIFVLIALSASFVHLG